MKWRDQWQLSFRNIFSAPVRSLLTVLGMSIGIGAILAVLTLGTAGRNQVRAEMTRLGIDRVWLTAARQEEPLMRGDGALLKRELKVAAAEQLTVPVKIAVGDKESETLLVGCDLVCLQMAGSAVTLGKMIPVQEWKQGGNGILLGETLAAELGGEVSSSRIGVDSGWIEKSRQVGQTGKTVHPNLYIACGISGAIQHLAGMESSEFIVAINKDDQCPMMNIADLGVQGDLKVIVPMLTEAVKAYKAKQNAI